MRLIESNFLMTLEVLQQQINYTHIDFSIKITCDHDEEKEKKRENKKRYE